MRKFTCGIPSRWLSIGGNFYEKFLPFLSEKQKPYPILCFLFPKLVCIVMNMKLHCSRLCGRYALQPHCVNAHDLERRLVHNRS